MLAAFLHHPRKEDERHRSQTLEDVAEEMLNGMFCHYEPPDPKKNRKMVKKTKGILRRPGIVRGLGRNAKKGKRKGDKSSNIGKSVTWSESVEGPDVSPQKKQTPKQVPESHPICNVTEACIEAGIEVGCITKDGGSHVKDYVVSIENTDKSIETDSNSKYKSNIVPPPPPPPPPPPTKNERFFPKICGVTLNCGEDEEQLKETTINQVEEITSSRIMRTRYDSEDDEESNSLLQDEDEDTEDDDDEEDDESSNKENDEVPSPKVEDQYYDKPINKPLISMKQVIEQFENASSEVNLPSENVVTSTNNTKPFFKRMWPRRKPKKTKSESPEDNSKSDVIQATPENRVSRRSRSKSPDSRSKILTSEVASKVQTVEKDESSNLVSEPAEAEDHQKSKVSNKNRLSHTTTSKVKNTSSNEDWDTSIAVIPEPSSSQETEKRGRSRKSRRESYPPGIRVSRSRSEEKRSQATSKSPSRRKSNQKSSKSPRPGSTENLEFKEHVPRASSRKSYPIDLHQVPVDVDDMMERQSFITAHRNSIDPDLEAERETAIKDDLMERQSFITAYRENLADGQSHVRDVQDSRQIREKPSIPTRKSRHSVGRSQSPRRSKSPSKSKSPRGMSNSGKAQQALDPFLQIPNSNDFHFADNGVSHINPLNVPRASYTGPQYPAPLSQITPSQMAAIEDYYRNNRIHEIQPTFYDPTNPTPGPQYPNPIYYADPVTNTIYPGQGVIGYNAYYGNMVPITGYNGMNYAVEPTHLGMDIPQQGFDDKAMQFASQPNLPFGGVVAENFADAVKDASNKNDAIEEGKEKVEEISWEERTRQAWERLRSGVVSSLGGDLSLSQTTIEATEPTSNQQNQIPDKQPGQSVAPSTQQGRVQQIIGPQLLSPPPDAQKGSQIVQQSMSQHTQTLPQLQSVEKLQLSQPLIQPHMLQKVWSQNQFPQESFIAHGTNVSQPRIPVDPYYKSTQNATSENKLAPAGILRNPSHDRKVTFGEPQHRLFHDKISESRSMTSNSDEQVRKKRVLRGSKYLNGVFGKNKRTPEKSSIVRSKSSESSNNSDFRPEALNLQSLSLSHSSDGSSQARLASMIYQKEQNKALLGIGKQESPNVSAPHGIHSSLSFPARHDASQSQRGHSNPQFQFVSPALMPSFSMPYDTMAPVNPYTYNSGMLNQNVQNASNQVTTLIPPPFYQNLPPNSNGLYSAQYGSGINQADIMGVPSYSSYQQNPLGNIPNQLM